MNRKLSGILGALVLGGAVLSGVVLAKPAEADMFHKLRQREARSRYRAKSRRYYRNGRWYSTYSAPRYGTYAVPRRGKFGDLDRDGIRNKWDRDRDGDGRRNRRDDHPSNRRRR